MRRGADTPPGSYLGLDFTRLFPYKTVTLKTEFPETRKIRWLHAFMVRNTHKDGCPEDNP